MKIGLHYSISSNNNGPGKVVKNLIKGLNLLDIEVISNEICEYNGILQLNYNALNYCNDTTLIGPNICVLPNEIPFIWTKFKKHIVPSDWVCSLYRSFDITKNNDIFVWPVGIDTDTFIDFEKKPKYDVLIYCKNRSNELDNILNYLNHKGLTHITLIYGKYSEEEFIQKANDCKVCILLTKTESQGIAYQEILSMNRPCYVLNKDKWDDYGIVFDATSVPYFDYTCGMIASDINFFEYFYENKNYKPREYIINNLSLLKQASKYIELLRL